MMCLVIGLGFEDFSSGRGHRTYIRTYFSSVVGPTDIDDEDESVIYTFYPSVLCRSRCRVTHGNPPLS